MVVVFSMPVTRFNSFGLTMLKVVRAQGQGLVSDSGRSGHQHEGVPLGGVLDRLSFEVGNLALGNPTDSACLELMGQFDFVCAKPCRIFMANRGAQALLNNKPVRCGQVFALQEGDVLRTQPPGLGFWNLICLQGGVDVPMVMGSRSTCLAAGFGGFQGRALQVGDEIHAGPFHAPAVPDHLRLALPFAPVDSAGHLVVHCLPGPEFDWLTDDSQHAFTSQNYRLGNQSSRMAYRLEGEQAPLALKQALTLRSHAVHPGVVQMPPSGQPVVLLSECQVTGGYPRIAAVLNCELWKFSQLASGQGIRWVVLDDVQAQGLQLQHERELKRYHHVIESSKQACHVD
jgi:5-oxoprolinase (ATP-hydrolysing) subunit C